MIQVVFDRSSNAGAKHIVMRLALSALLVMAVFPAADQRRSCAADRPIATTVHSALRDEMIRLDIDKNERLSLAEFLNREGEQRVLKRDFRLYDLDENGFLTFTEFASVSGLCEPSLRGPMPDPVDVLVAEAVAALDESYGRWHERPGEMVNAHTFVANFLGSISLGGKRFVTGRILQQADRDADGRIGRSEARQFLEYQLGVRWSELPLLREPTGRLVRLDRFLAMDDNQDRGISREEYLQNATDRTAAASEFERTDRNANGRITYSEFAHYSSPNYSDPVEWFRAADTSLNARLSAQELEVASTQSRVHLVASTISAFDDNADGELSLNEYRMSMHANVNYPWHARTIDLNRDGRLSYGEFVFHSIDLFQLQRRYYFHRLDQDSSGFLSADEFSFLRKKPFSIHRQRTDQRWTRSSQIYQSSDYPECGGISVSRDKSRLLFHRYPTHRRDESQVIAMDADGGNLVVLCSGIHPCWSPTGEQFACERREVGGVESVWIMERDGESGAPVAEGRCPEWSADGRSIAYQQDNGIWIYDVKAGVSREIYRREDHRYRDLGEAIAWSPDHQRLALLANLGNRTDLVIVDVRTRKAKTRTSFAGVHREDVNWTSSLGIIFGRSNNGASELRSIAPDNTKPASAFTRLDPRHKWKSACITADGEWYIAISAD